MIEPSESDGASSIILLKKEEGQVNEALCGLQGHRYISLPRIDDILDQIGQAQGVRPCKRLLSG